MAARRWISVAAEKLRLWLSDCCSRPCVEQERNGEREAKRPHRAAPAKPTRSASRCLFGNIGRVSSCALGIGCIRWSPGPDIRCPKLAKSRVAPACFRHASALVRVTVGHLYVCPSGRRTDSVQGLTAATIRYPSRGTVSMKRPAWGRREESAERCHSLDKRSLERRLRQTIRGRASHQC